MTHALVTGGTGFIGSRVVDRLLDEGWNVTILAREPGRLLARHVGRVEVMKADLQLPLPPLPPHDVLIHCAADMIVGHSLAKMRLTTVDGTERLLAAAKLAGTGRFVHVSSQAVYGFDHHHENADETTPTRTSPYAYPEAKRMAEEAVWVAARGGLPVTVVRPGFVYGVGEKMTILPIVRALRAGQIRAHVAGGGFDTGCAHVENVADGIFLAASVPGALGEVYNLGDGRVLTIREMVDQACKYLGVPAPTGIIPLPVAWALSAMVEGAWTLVGSDNPPMSRFMVAIVSRNSGFSIAKARAELGYEPRRQWEESLPAMLDWCQAQDAERAA